MPIASVIRREACQTTTSAVVGDVGLFVLRWDVIKLRCINMQYARRVTKAQ
jgi:hypothetical protein